HTTQSHRLRSLFSCSCPSRMSTSVNWMSSFPERVLLVGGIDHPHDPEKTDRNPHEHDHEPAASARHQTDTRRCDQKAQERHDNSRKRHRSTLLVHFLKRARLLRTREISLVVLLG